MDPRRGSSFPARIAAASKGAEQSSPTKHQKSRRGLSTRLVYGRAPEIEHRSARGLSSVSRALRLGVEVCEMDEIDQQPRTATESARLRVIVETAGDENRQLAPNVYESYIRFLLFILLRRMLFSSRT